MKFKISETQNEERGKLVALQYTKKITGDDLADPAWSELKRQYKAVNDPVGKAVVSITNSILFQKRAVFAPHPISKSK